MNFANLPDRTEERFYMTNGESLELLIEAAIEVGKGQQSSGCDMVPRWTNRLAIMKSGVLDRMRPETEVVPGVTGEEIEAAAQASYDPDDPTLHLVTAKIPDEEPKYDVLIPDGGGESIPGR